MLRPKFHVGELGDGESFLYRGRPLCIFNALCLSWIESNASLDFDFVNGGLRPDSLGVKDFDAAMVKAFKKMVSEN